MNVFIDLLWYFKQQKRRYITGILLLALVSLCLLVPPKIIGFTVDHIREETLTGKMLFLYLVILLAVASAVYILRFFWRIMIYGASIELAFICGTAFILILRTCPPAFIKKEEWEI